MDLSKSFFKLEDLDGKDLIFADPMNATGGSLVTVIKYLQSQGVKPKSIAFFNTISIKERTNTKLQMQFVPKKYSKDVSI